MAHNLNAGVYSVPSCAFIAQHVVGEPLPLWYATWGVKQEIEKWLAGQQVSEGSRATALTGLTS